MIQSILKSVFFIAIILGASLSLMSQSPHGSLLSISSKNQSPFFYHMQGAYDFNNSNHFTDNLNYSARLAYNPRSKKKFQIPVILFVGQLKSSNAMVENTKQQIVNENFGLGVGIHPEFAVIPYENSFYLNFNVALSWRFNTFQTAQDEIKFLNSGRASLNVEVGYNLFKKFSNNRPLSLTITPIRSIFEADDHIDLYQSSSMGFNAFEISTIIPVGKGDFSITGKSIIIGSSVSYIGFGVAINGQL